MITNLSKNKFKVILVIIIIFLIAYIIFYFYDMEQTKQQSLLLNNVLENLIVDSEQSNDLVEDNVTEETVIEKNERMLKVEELQKENSDLIGWIEIIETPINYPVLQTDNNDFYLNHNYKKESTKSGSIFIDADYRWTPKSTNLLMYGHNMKNGTMFTSLLNYRNEDYFDAHPNIRFTTATTDVTYEIIAAFDSKVYDENDNSFKYYNFINATNKEEFENFIYNIKKLTTYDTNNTAYYGDDLITLSTCAYHVKDGRFAVVGKSISK